MKDSYSQLLSTRFSLSLKSINFQGIFFLIAPAADSKVTIFASDLNEQVEWTESTIESQSPMWSNYIKATIVTSKSPLKYFFRAFFLN